MTGSVELDAFTHIVGHLWRETESALRDIVRPIHPELRDKKRGKGPNDRPDKHKEEIKAILEQTSISLTDPQAVAWLGLAGRLHGLAHRDDLKPPRRRDEDFDSLWEELNVVLDTVLDRLMARYAKFHERVDELLSLPHKHQVLPGIKELPLDVDLVRYFFSKISGCDWLKPLADHQFFDDVPGVEQDGRSTRHPPWPAGEFLAANAAGAPDQALEILLQTTANSNLQVQRLVVETASKLTAPLAARWVTANRRLFRSQPWLHLVVAESLGALASSLASGAQGRAAISVVSILLGLVKSRGDASSKRTDARTRPEPYEIKRLLKSHVGTFLSVAPDRTLRYLATQLTQALRATGDPVRPLGPPSLFWRASIADSKQNVDHDALGDIFISALRDACDQVVRSGQLPLQSIVEILTVQPAPLHRRIALHIVTKHPDTKLVTEFLLDVRWMHDLELHHEYWLLASTCFPLLSPGDRQTLLDRIMLGPPAAAIESSSDSGAAAPTGEDPRRTLAWWRLRRLLLLESHLDESGKARIQEEERITGSRPEHPEFLSYFEVGFVGWSSPISLEEAQILNDAELVGRLERFSPTPSHDSKGPTREGVATMLAQLVGTDPNRYARLAPRFASLHATYALGFVDGFDRLCRDKRDLDWAPVLELCVAIAKCAPGSGGDLDHARGEDKSWGPARHAVASMLRELMEKQLPAIGCRALAWSAIELLTHDPDPSPDREAEGGDNFEPVTTALNSIRGNAVHAAIAYCHWVKKNVEWVGMQSVPEASAVLEHHMTPSLEPSRAVHSVFGWLLPWIVSLDADWATNMGGLIFPADAAYEAHREAAWIAFLAHQEPRPDLLRVFGEQYQRAVDEVGTRPPAPRTSQNHDQRLGEHLMVMYWQGTTSLDEPSGLLAQFFAKASDAVRGQVIASAGRALMNSKEVAEFCRDRLATLWQSRLQAAAKEPASHAEELAAFARWFGTPHFEAEWALAQAARGLELSPRMDPEYAFLERLAEVAKKDHAQAATRCLALWVTGSAEVGMVQYKADEIRGILLAGKSCGHPPTEQLVRATANRLVALGARDFMDLAR